MAETGALRLLPLAILIATGAGWGAAVPIAKYGVSNGYHASVWLFWVIVGAGVISLTVACLRGTPPKLTWPHLRYYVVVGTLRLVCANVLWYSIVAIIPAGVMSVILGTAPIFTYALALAFRMEKFEALRLAGIAMGFVAILMFILPKQSLPDPSMAGWVALAFLAPFFYSCGNVAIAWLRPKDGESMALSAGMLWTVALILLPIAYFSGDIALWNREFSVVEQLLIVHMIINGFTFLGLFELVRLGGPTYASQLTYIVTVTGILIGIVLFDERHSLWVWGGAAMVFVGVALVNLGARRASA